MSAVDPCLVTVLTATRDGADWLPETIASVRRQSFPRYEHLIVDDGSEDTTPQLLAAYAAADARVRLVRNERALGVGAALNRGLAAAQGAYIAILDHDDLAAPRRLERQIQFLERRPEVGVLGTAFDWFDGQGRRYRQRNPTDPDLIRWALLFSNPVCHSSAMLRRELVLQSGGYSSRQRYAADYELFIRLARRTALANLSEPLAAYRVSASQASRLYREPQHAEALLLVYAQLRRLLDDTLPLALAQAVYRARMGTPLNSADAVAQVSALLHRTYAAFVGGTSLSTAGARRVRERLALQLLTLGAANAGHARSTALLVTRRALEIDPVALLRPTTWHILRLHRRRRHGRGPEQPRTMSSEQSTRAGASTRTSRRRRGAAP